MAPRRHPGTLLVRTCLAVLAGVLCPAQMCAVDGVDTDGDGTPDAIDRCPLDPDKTAPGFCGCGNPDTDSDDDGAPDCVDQDPDDPTKISDDDGCNCGG